MSKLDWKRNSNWRKVRAGKGFELEDEWKIKKKYASYRDGNFWIGLKLIARWNPDKAKHPGDGIFLNKKNGKFEAWKDGKLLSAIPWKRDWKELVCWGERFGIKNESNKER
jgi:hypothetical protein